MTHLSLGVACSLWTFRDPRTAQDREASGFYSLLTIGILVSYIGLFARLYRRKYVKAS